MPASLANGRKTFQAPSRRLGFQTVALALAFAAIGSTGHADSIVLPRPPDDPMISIEWRRLPKLPTFKLVILYGGDFVCSAGQHVAAGSVSERERVFLTFALDTPGIGDDLSRLIAESPCPNEGDGYVSFERESGERGTFRIPERFSAIPKSVVHFIRVLGYLETAVCFAPVDR